MKEQDECIICFDSFSLDNNETCYYKKNVKKILNTRLVLSCGHYYHLGCIITYIKTLYSSWKRKTTIDSCSSFFMNCPFCRCEIEESEIISIIDKFNYIKTTKLRLNQKLSKLKMEIFWLRIKLYSKKMMNFTNLPKEVFYYHQKLDEYDDFEFLNTKINYLTKDTDSLYNIIIKNNNKLCNFYDDHDDIW